MVKDAAYREAEKKIEEAQRTNASKLLLGDMKLTELPGSLWELTQLKILYLHSNKLTSLPTKISQLSALQELHLSNNKQLKILPSSLKELKKLKVFSVMGDKVVLFKQLCELRGLEILILGAGGYALGHNSYSSWFSPTHYDFREIPNKISNLSSLRILLAGNAHITDLPSSLAQLKHLTTLNLDLNPLNPELAVAYKEGLPAVMAYLRAKAEGHVVLNEAKLILVGEGGVGKTSLLAALRGDPFIENRPTTHGVEVDITSLAVGDPDNGTEITLNGWDFGGQNIYRHTHQLFFTAPAIYLAIWEPRRGPEQSRVAEWIKMIKHRAYDEARPDERPRILVVATHGDPSERLDHIDEQALRDEFGDLIVGFHHVDSKPDENGICYQLDELKTAIGREAAAIPSVGRTVPLSWKKALKALRKRSKEEAYISYKQFKKLCNRHSVSNDLAATYAVILNELGHLIYYRHDEALKNTVILNPEYLSKAVGFVLEDKTTKEAHGLIEHTRLGTIWHNPDKPAEERYPEELHSVFLRLMEKFDLSYQVVMPQLEAPPTSLMAQLVPGPRPQGWQEDWQLKLGDTERTQVCRVLDAETGRTVEAEGLMYRLIVRLHRYSLGRDNYYHSRHWKTGMILDDGYNGRGFIEEIGGDVYVTVRAAYPERFLHHLCSEIQWLVEHFWKGLDARMYVPCPLETCKGLLELEEMMDFLRNGMLKVRCAVCKEFHEIDSLMATMQPKLPVTEALSQIQTGLHDLTQMQQNGIEQLSTQLRAVMSQADEQYAALLNSLADPAKGGPRLFSFEPVDRSRFNPKSWTREKFRLTLWCEHRRLPLPVLNEADDSSGVYEIELTRDWVQKAAPVVKIISTTLKLALPIALPGAKLATDDEAYKGIAEQLEFGTKTSDALIKGGEEVGDWLVVDENSDLAHSRQAIRAKGSVLRELHALLREVDPANGFGGLERVRNKRQEFLWVHKQYLGEY